MLAKIAGLSLLAAACSYAARDVEIEKLETIYRVQPDNTGEMRFHERLRALTAQGRAEASSIRMPYVAGFQDAEFTAVRTIKGDGTVVAGDPSRAFDANLTNDPGGAYYTDARYKVILPPNVDTGDVVEWEGVVHIHRWLKPGDFWFTHRLDRDPSVRSETVVLDLPAGRKASLYENPQNPGKVEVSGGRRLETWQAANASDAQVSLEAAPPLFAVSSIPSWDALGEWIRSLNAGPTEPTGEIRELAAKLISGKQADAEKIAALYSYVATRVRYVAVEFSIGRMQPHPAAEVLRNAYGDCKDQTALLSALLISAGFKPAAVLVTPGSGVEPDSVPTPESFTHEFAAVETKSGLMFLDPSLGPAPPQVLSPGVRGRSAFIVASDSARLAGIPSASPVPTRVKLDVKGSIAASGAFEGSVRLETQGILEVVFRRLFLDATDADKEKFLVAILGPEFTGGGVRQVMHADPADLSKPFWISFEASKSDFFPTSRPSMNVSLGTTLIGSVVTQREQTKPSKPIPSEPVEIRVAMDLAVPSAITLTNGMPVHRSSPPATYDSEYTYKDGHQKLARALVITGAPIRPEDWDSWKDLTRAAREEVPLSLGRHSSPVSPSAVDTAIRAGAAAFQQADYAEAKKQYLEATRLDPQSKTAWNNLGRVYNRLKEYDKAEAAYRKQIEINPQDHYAYNNLGVMYVELKRDDDAIAMYRKQLEIVPRDLTAHTNLSNRYAARKQWDRAIAEAGTAVEIQPDNANLRVQLGRWEMRGGRREDAVREFDRALAMTHTSTVENNVAFYLAEGGYELERARQLILGTLEPEARRVCEPSAISKDDQCAAQLARLSSWLDTAGWVMYRQGRSQEAEAYLRSSWAIAPRADPGVHLAAILAALGRTEEAARYFNQASALDGFSSADDVEETRATLAKLNAPLGSPDAPPGAEAVVIALVDGSGKVTEAQGVDGQTPEEAIAAAKATTLPAIAWADHSIRSIRTIQLREQSGSWVITRSAVGQPK